MIPLNVGLIIGSTRPNRFADVAARWIEQGAASHPDIALTLLDLRDADLPLFDEPVSPAMSGGAFSRPEADAWRQKLAPLDGYIATVAEYNHGPTAVLKNAFDSAWLEWQRKPIAFVGYGGVGAARAIEQLRGVAIELQMAPLKHEVNITREPLLGVLRDGKSLDDYPHLVDAREALFEDLIWWGAALRDARTYSRPKAA